MLVSSYVCPPYSGHPPSGGDEVLFGSRGSRKPVHGERPKRVTSEDAGGDHRECEVWRLHPALPEIVFHQPENFWRWRFLSIQLHGKSRSPRYNDDRDTADLSQFWMACQDLPDDPLVSSSLDGEPHGAGERDRQQLEYLSPLIFRHRHLDLP